MVERDPLENVGVVLLAVFATTFACLGLELLGFDHYMVLSLMLFAFIVIMYASGDITFFPERRNRRLISTFVFAVVLLLAPGAIAYVIYGYTGLGKWIEVLGGFWKRIFLLIFIWFISIAVLIFKDAIEEERKESEEWRKKMREYIEKLKEYLAEN